MLSTLPNSLTLITIARPETPTVAARLLVRAGSRYDSDQPPAASPPLGLAHFTEHRLFQNPDESSPETVLAAVEHAGGLFEAETTKEYSRFTVVTTPPELPTALRVLARVLQPRPLPAAHFATEKLTIAQELANHQDQYSVIFDHFAALMWPAHPLRHPVLGTPAGLAAITPAQVDAFFRQRYVTGNMVLVVCGAIDPAETARLAERFFGGLPPGPAQPPPPGPVDPLAAPRRQHIPRNMGQSYLLLGVPTVGMKHADRSALKVIERVLGMGTSGRLYQRLRRREGLVYSVRTVTAHYEDAGYLAVATACAPAQVANVREAILAEWDDLCQSGITAKELRAAQRNYAGTLARRFETNVARAGITGVEYLLHRPETLAEARDRLNAVQRADVLRQAQTYLNSERYVAVVVGPSEPDRG